MINSARRAATTAVLTVTLTSLAGCGATPVAPTSPFALDAGTYTLKVSGGGSSSGTIPSLCGTSGSSILEGNVPVVVTRSGSTWSTRAATSPDAGWAMTFTTDGTATGSVTGSLTGPALDPSANVTITVTNATIDGRNGGSNIAGGSIQGPVQFTTTSGSAFCTQGTWTLAPR